MKISKIVFLITAIITVLSVVGCATKAKTIDLENKGSTMGIPTPEWVTTYISSGVTRLQSQPEYRDKYIVIGEEYGVNKQFVLAWADNFSAQQRIGAMLRTNIASEYNAKVRGLASSEGVAGSTPSTGVLQQEIDSTINTIVNVSYSGAQREADWWLLERRYDPDVKDKFTDEYRALVMYTIPRSQLNEQVARALETSVSRDSALYDVTIDMARQILVDGLSRWGEE